MRAYLNGDVSKAIAILDNDKLAAAVSQAKREKEEAQKKLDSAVQSYLLKGQLLTTQFNFAAAEEAYQTAIAVSPESFHANFDYAYFSQDLNHFSLARKAYERCLQLPLTPAQRATTLNNLGALYRGENRMVEARQVYEEALRIRRQLAEKDPDTYLPDVASTLNNLGNLHRAENSMLEARQAFEEAVKIYRRLARKDLDTYLPYVALALNNLGNLRGDENRMGEAAKPTKKPSRSVANWLREARHLSLRRRNYAQQPGRPAQR